MIRSGKLVHFRLWLLKAGHANYII